MIVPSLAALMAGTIVPTAELPVSMIDPCARFEHRVADADAPRLVTSNDLVELADIGRPDPHESESPFGVSPDGKAIAFLERRANAQENEYCQRLLVKPLHGNSEPKELDRGGSFIRNDSGFLNFVSLMSGTAKVIRPRWSPDGSRIGYVKRVGTTSQVWIVAADGRKGAFRATDMTDNVDDFAWTPGGDALLVATRPGIRQQAETIVREARTGFLFDDRFAPAKADRPIPTGPVEVEYKLVELANGGTRDPTEQEIGLLKPYASVAGEPAKQGYKKSSVGADAWREPIFPKRLISPAQPVMALPSGQPTKCTQDYCSGTRELWWSKDGNYLFMRQKTGWGGSQTALLAWKVGEQKPRQVLVTDDVLVGCELADDRLICAREGTGRTRRLVAINPTTGRERVIYDPNPEFQKIALGEVRRFRFRNAFGAESWSDLVLPPQHKAGEKHPLVVVQYFSHGFLRGGTGDEVPVQLLAAKGFAVLSFARPDLEPKAETDHDLSIAFQTDWIDRRSVQSSLEMSIDLAIATGTVDKDRMGISGFSDGTSTTQWALLNSSLFKVAAMGACCEDIYAYPLTAGPYFTQWTRDFGYRFFEPGTEDYWKPMSLTLNVDRVDTPILVQTGDSEYEIGLDVAEVYRRRGKAFELYVFDGESHVKYQPAHRQAMYERSVQWFQFWLKQEMNCDRLHNDQYIRWKAMPGAAPPERLKCEPSSVLP